MKVNFHIIVLNRNDKKVEYKPTWQFGVSCRCYFTKYTEREDKVFRRWMWKIICWVIHNLSFINHDNKDSLSFSCGRRAYLSPYRTDTRAVQWVLLCIYQTIPLQTAASHTDIRYRMASGAVVKFQISRLSTFSFISLKIFNDNDWPPSTKQLLNVFVIHSSSGLKVRL